MRRMIAVEVALAVVGTIAAQTAGPFTLTRQHDSLYYLNEWRLPYPVYRFATGDVDGDGSVDALVGVIKTTRFDPVARRRLFIFKLTEGKVRPLWLGSRLGGLLCDFRWLDGRVRSLEASADSLYSVSLWHWKDFGLEFERFIVHRTAKKTAVKCFEE